MLGTRSASDFRGLGIFEYLDGIYYVAGKEGAEKKQTDCVLKMRQGEGMAKQRDKT
jgi:hypothetical protein